MRCEPRLIASCARQVRLHALLGARRGGVFQVRISRKLQLASVEVELAVINRCSSASSGVREVVLGFVGLSLEGV